MIPQPAPAVHDFPLASSIEEEAGPRAALWRAHTVALSVAGVASGGFEAVSVAADAASAGEGALFFAAAGDSDAAIAAAFARGAAAAVSARAVAGPHVRVADIAAARLALARAARNRTRATVIAAAGFAPDLAHALFAALDGAAGGLAERCGAERCGNAAAAAGIAPDSRFALAEQADAALLAALRPHVVVIGGETARGEAEALVAALVPGGVAVLPAGRGDLAPLRGLAGARGAGILGYGRNRFADIRLLDCVGGPDGAALVTADMGDRRICYALAGRGPLPADRIDGSLAVMAAVHAADASLGAAAIALAGPECDRRECAAPVRVAR